MIEQSLNPVQGLFLLPVKLFVLPDMLSTRSMAELTGLMVTWGPLAGIACEDLR